MSDKHVLCVIVNREKMTDYERKMLKEVTLDISKNIVPEILKSFKDLNVRREDIKCYFWNNNSNLIIEIDNLSEDTRKKQGGNVQCKFSSLVDKYLLKKYREAFIDTSMIDNIKVIYGYSIDNSEVNAVEHVELKKDKVTRLGKHILDHISDDDIKEALAYLKELLQYRSFESLKIENADLLEVDDSSKVRLRVYVKIGREKLLRYVDTYIDMNESTPSKVVMSLESQHPKHLEAFKKELENIILISD